METMHISATIRCAFLRYVLASENAKQIAETKKQIGSRYFGALSHPFRIRLLKFDATNKMFSFTSCSELTLSRIAVFELSTPNCTSDLKINFDTAMLIIPTISTTSKHVKASFMAARKFWVEVMSAAPRASCKYINKTG